jgi:hypothetical protein
MLVADLAWKCAEKHWKYESVGIIRLCRLLSCTLVLGMLHSSKGLAHVCI